MCFSMLYENGMIGENNIFNIRYSKRNNWKGQTGQFRGFCNFDTRDNAIRACFVLLVNYIRSGYDTYRKIIYRFAPPSENDSKGYLKFVCRPALAFLPNIDPDSEVATYEQLLNLMCKMAYIENSVYLDIQQIRKAIHNEDDTFLFTRIKM